VSSCALLYAFFWVIAATSKFYMPTFRNTLFHLRRQVGMKMEQCVPKRRYMKFRRRGIIQKKAYSIQSTAKVWNQESYILVTMLWSSKLWGSSRTVLSLRKNLSPSCSAQDEPCRTNLHHSATKMLTLNIHVVTLNVRTCFSLHGMIIIWDDVRCTREKTWTDSHNSLIDN